MNAEKNHLGALTGMRFFAAMAVVVGHLVTDHNLDGSGRFGLTSYSTVLGGAAVSFFFVLSGFILTYVYKDQLTYARVPKFYFKRWARIWPLHLVCLVVTIYVVGMVVIDYEMLAVNLALLQSWVPDSKWVFSFNGVSWSISTEMFFYFMFPFFLIGGQKRFWFKYLLLWFLVLAAVKGIQILENDPAWADYDLERACHVNPFLRLPEFCAGMGVGFIFFNRAPLHRSRSQIAESIFEIAALSLIPIFSKVFREFEVVSLVLRAEWGGPAMALWVQYTAMVFVFAIVIYVFARSHGVFSKFLGSRAMVFLGEISFALYMIHYTVIMAVERQYDWSLANYSPWQVAGCVILISICIAALLYKLVEMPAKNALLSLYSRKFKKAAMTFPMEWWRCLKTPVFWSCVVLLVGCMSVIDFNYQPMSSANDVIEASHAPYRDVEFGDHIRLMGAEAVAMPAGIRLSLVWRKQKDLERTRFLHLCDEDGKVLGQLAPEKKLFEQANSSELFVETLLLPLAKLSDPQIASVGIGFYSEKENPETGRVFPMLVVKKGPVGLDRCRLNVIVPAQMNNLRKEIARINEVKK
jgi:peptidoglycan/LPS O-acetylase OafA/YrhL